MHPEETAAESIFPPPPSQTAAQRQRFWFALLVMLATTLGCSAADLLERPAPTPAPTRTLAPTFTPTPPSQQGVIIVTPPVQGTPGVIIVPEGADIEDLLPTLLPPTAVIPPPNATGVITGGTPGIGPVPIETDTPSATPSETPTITPTDTPSPTPSVTPTPFVVVQSGLVALRTGPGVEFPLYAQLGPGIPIAITGQNPEGSWYQLCCVNGQTVWVVASHVLVNNDPRMVALQIGGTPPSPTPTLPPTATGTATFTPTATPYPFQRTIGPQFFPTENKFITVWAKLHVGPLRLSTGCDPENTTANKEAPAEGYFLRVLFEGFERPSTNGVQASTDQFACSASVGAGNRFEYNIKYEYRPPDPGSVTVVAPTPTRSAEDLIGTGTWTIFIIDGAGNQLSEAVTFTSQPGNPNREVYIGWERIR